MRKLTQKTLLKSWPRRLRRGSESSAEEAHGETCAGTRCPRKALRLWRPDGRISATKHELVPRGRFSFAASAGYFRHARCAGDAADANASARRAKGNRTP